MQLVCRSASERNLGLGKTVHICNKFDGYNFNRFGIRISSRVVLPVLCPRAILLLGRFSSPGREGLCRVQTLEPTHRMIAYRGTALRKQHSVSNFVALAISSAGLGQLRCTVNYSCRLARCRNVFISRLELCDRICYLLVHRVQYDVVIIFDGTPCYVSPLNIRM